MSWILAEYWATTSTLDVAQDALLHAGSIGIEIDDGLGPEGQKKYPDDQILIRAYFEKANFDQNYILEVLLKFFLNPDKIKFCDFKQQDWQKNFVKSCVVIKVEPDIYIVPTFLAEDFHKNHQGQLFIELDPENAFGTGQHETTKLCLTAIYTYLANNNKNLQAIDIGTGSGILAILLKKLGVTHVLATETDESALITAERNAHNNHVNFDMLLVDEEYKYNSQSFDLIIANILAPVLISMSRNIFDMCKLGGQIILSGILVEQADLVIKAYEVLGAKLVCQKIMNSWCILEFTREKKL